MIADIALPIPYDWFLLATRVLIAAILLGFLWRVLIVVGREALLTAPAGGQLSLALLDEFDQPVRGFRLSRRKPMTIGRDPSNDIVLADRSVSGNHAVIRYLGGEWVLADLDSRNGTYVNGAAIATETSISEHDVVQFGAVRLQMLTHESSI
ncbi:MAG TPA: FHA domain-containing protein [Thermomicrobiales bacterium]|nr:FHA domain-containing protein [Thermomicrobiales bacterium]